MTQVSLNFVSAYAPVRLLLEEKYKVVVHFGLSDNITQLSSTYSRITLGLRSFECVRM